LKRLPSRRNTGCHFEKWKERRGACVEILAQGAARALEAAEKDDKALVICIGGDSLMGEWNSGYEGCWVAALHTFEMLYTEPMVCGLVAMIDGRATPETLWPDWVKDGDAYAQVVLDAIVLTHDNYQAELAAVEEYTATHFAA